MPVPATLTVYPRARRGVEDGNVRHLLSLAAVVVASIALISLVAPARLPAGEVDSPAPGSGRAEISSVVVHFADGSEQRLDAAAPATRPTVPPPATAPTTAPDPAAPPRAIARRVEPFLGVNLESLRDYDRQLMFIDAMKTSRRWGSPNKTFDGKGIVGPDGWPGDDAGTLVFTDAKNVNGVYKFSCTGRCDLVTTGSSAKVMNHGYDRANNRTVADVVVMAPKDKPVTLSLAFKNTAGGVKDIKLIRPGYADDSKVFTNEFLAALRPFGAIRFMDYLKTNNSQVKAWDDRCKVTDPQYTLKGGPYELAVELGNVAGKDVWLNVPALADDDFVRQLGALVRERLRPDLNCYVEYSNEVWNGMFQQFKQNQAAAEAEVAAGESTLNDGGKDNNKFYWARKRVAKRAVEIKRLLGDDPRFRVLLASQVGFAPPGSMLKQQLEYVEKHHGPPAKFFYAVACAPYFSTGRDENDPARKKWFSERKDLTIDLICERLLIRTDASGSDGAKAFHALARQYGLKSFGYEGGLDLQQHSSQVHLKIASQYDPRTGLAVEKYLDRWYAAGGDAIFYFTLSCKYDRNGYWGLTEDVRDMATPKYQAAVRVAEKLATHGAAANAAGPANGAGAANGASPVNATNAEDAAKAADTATAADR